MVLYKRKITKKKYKGGATSAEIRDFINKRAASTIQKRTKKRLNMQKDKGVLFSNEMRKGVSVYSRSLPTINLEGAVIDDMTLSNKSLDGINLKGSKINNSKLVKTKLRGTNLTNTIINNCTLRDSNFTGAILHKAHFTNIGTCENINFSDANLSQSKFINVFFCSPIFHNSNLENAHFDNCGFKNFARKAGIPTACNNIFKFGNANIKNLKLINISILPANNSVFDIFHGAPGRIGTAEAPPRWEDGDNGFYDNITIKGHKTTFPNPGTMSQDRSIAFLQFQNSHFEDITLNYAVFRDNAFQFTEFIKFNIRVGQIIKNNFSTCDFKNCDFYNTRIRENIFENCEITNCDFTNAIFEEQSFKSPGRAQPLMKNNKFQQTTFIGGTDTRISTRFVIPVNFENCNLENSSFNGADLRNVNFKKANLRGTQFIPVTITFADGTQETVASELGQNELGTERGVIFDSETLFEGATFQSTNGLEDRDFTDCKLVGTSFHGCSLINTNFRRADLRNAIFRMCVITDCDFTGANIEGIQIDAATRETARPGFLEQIADIPAIYPSDIHEAFDIVKINDLYNELSNIMEEASASDDDDFNRKLVLIDSANTNTEINQVITTTIFRGIIDNMKPDFDDEESRRKLRELQERLIRQWDSCIEEKLKTYDYDSRIPRSDPDITWKEMFKSILGFLLTTSLMFRENYVTNVILESANVYGDGGLSCPKGIVERFVVKLRDAILLIKDELIRDRKLETLVIYNKLLNALDPTRDWNEPEENLYFEVTQAMRDEWKDQHNPNGEGLPALQARNAEPFEADATTQDLLNDYEKFLKLKFIPKPPAKLSEPQKAVIKSIIDKELDFMRIVIEMDGDTAIEHFMDGGSRRKRNKRLRIFSDPKLFAKLCKKFFKSNKQTRKKKIKRSK